MNSLAAPPVDAWPCAGLWLDRDGRVGAINAECAGALGVCADEVLGRSLGDLLAAPSRMLWHSALWPAVQVRGRVDDATLVFNTRSGPWGASAAVRLGQGSDLPGFSVLLLPAGDRQRVQEELRNARRSLEAIPGAVLQCRRRANGELEFAYASSGVLDLLGLTPAQVVGPGSVLLGALLPGDASAFEAGLAQAEAANTAQAQQAGFVAVPATWRVSVHATRRPRRTLEWLAQCEVTAGAGDTGALWHGVLLDVSERERLQSELREQIATDELTGLPNRRGLRDPLQQAIDGGEPFALFFMDVDRFKQVNDSLGHEAGDSLLREVARRLRRALRPADRLLRPAAGADGALPASPLAARLGGDEFVVLVQGLSDRDRAATLAERLQARLAQPMSLGRLRVHPGVSIGIVLGDRHSTAAQLMRDADTAMYEAKRQGRGRYVHFEPAMHARAAQALSLEAELRDALARQQLRAVFQPIVDISSGRLVGMEALARWRHPQRGEVSPADFVPLAEDAGLIAALGESILRQACQHYAGWARAGLAVPPRVSVNLSRAQLVDPGLPQRVKAIVEECGLTCGALQFEITESLAMQNDGALAVLSALRELGIQLALDDFGTGHSSLAALQSLPVRQLKIDRSFVREVETSAYHRALVQAALQVAHALELEVVAEGVETESQARTLADLGCTRAQGYLYARPLEADAMATYLATDRGPAPAWPPATIVHAAGHSRAHQVLITDAQGLTLFANPSFCLNTGYSLADIQGRKPGSLLQGRDTDPRAVQQLREAVASGQGCLGVEIVNYRKDGTPFWVLVDIEPVRDSQGRVERFVSVQSEITAQRAALAELDMLRSRSRRVAELGLVGFWERNLHNGEGQADDTTRHLLALPPGAPMPSWPALAERATPESRPALLAYFDAVQAGAQRGVTEFSLLQPDGQPVHLQTMWTREGDNILGVLADVGGSQQLRREREVLLHQLELASLAAKQYFWRYDLASGLVDLLPARGHPYPVDAQGRCTAEAILEAVLPEDRPALQRARQTATQQPGVVEAVYRLRDPQGQVRYLLSRRIGWHSPNAAPGAPAQVLLGVSVDITAERMQQAELQALAEQNALVLEAARLAPFRLDLREMVFHFGAPFARMYGLAEDCRQLTLAQWEACVHPDDRQALIEAGRRLRNSDECGVSQTRFRIVRPDGSVRVIQGHRQVLRDANGRALVMLGAHADLTAQPPA